jgi:predicted nucleic acid-binding protein
MIFLDTNVIMYAVGGPHPLRDSARALLKTAAERSEALATSTEVFQELLHAYLPVDRIDDLDRAWRLLRAVTVDTWSVEPDDVELARSLRVRHPELSARDLVHLACCRRRGVERAHTLDRALRAAVGLRNEGGP